MSLPDRLAAAVAPAIPPRLIDMSNMSGSRLGDACDAINGIVFAFEVKPSSPADRFTPYNWRPQGRSVDLQEIPASNGDPPEFYRTYRSSTPQGLPGRAVPRGSSPLRAPSTAPSFATATARRSNAVALLRVARSPDTSPRFGVPAARGAVLSTLRSARLAAQSARFDTVSSTAVAAPRIVHGFASLLSHLESQVPLDLRGDGITFADARTAFLQLQFNQVVVSSIRRVVIRGHTDAVGLHPQSVALDRVVSGLDLSLALFDWKTPRAMEPSNNLRVKAQLCIQAIAFREKYGYSVPVVATDLCSAIRIWSLDGQVLTEYLSSARRALTLDEGMSIVWQLMREQVPKVRSWLEAKRSAPFTRRDGGEDDGGNSDAPPDLDNFGPAPHADVVPEGGDFGAGAGCLAARRGDAGGGVRGGTGDQQEGATISAAELALYDDVEQEGLTQRVAAVWNNSPHLLGLVAQIAAAEAVL